MPRVSQQHLDDRREQILEAARRCFLREGFHTTSMQDIFTEAGLSAGAVYRYFPGKEQIVAAIAASVFDAFLELIAGTAERFRLPGLVDVVDELFDVIDRLQRERQIPAIALQVWAESLRDPRLSRLFHEEMSGITVHLQELIERSQRTGMVSDTLSPRALASSISMMMQGYVVQRVALGEEVSQQSRIGIRALLGAQTPTIMDHDQGGC